MDPDKKRLLQYLFSRYSNRLITREEYDDLLQMIAEPENDGQVKELLAELWQAMDAPASAPVRKRGMRRLLPWIAAAASVALLLAAGFVWYRAHHTQTGVSVAQSRPADIPPGGNKAVLTLSNGQQIVLDSAHTGQLARQGSSNIIKVDSGLLAYQTGASTGSATAASTGSATAASTGPLVEGAIQYNTLSTPRGGQYRLVLPDGTKVWLNAASSIRYPTAFNGKERRVEITGEAYFEVVHDSRMPFIVTANGQVVEDLGTAFDINAYSEEPVIKATLIAGSIKVNNRILSPGQQARVVIQTGKLTVEKADTAGTIAWVNGKLSLEGDNIQTLMREISRWYNVDVHFEGKLPERSFVGMINRDVYLSNVLKALDTYGIHTKLEGKTVIVSAQ